MAIETKNKTTVVLEAEGHLLEVTPYGVESETGHKKVIISLLK